MIHSNLTPLLKIKETVYTIRNCTDAKNAWRIIMLKSPIVEFSYPATLKLNCKLVIFKMNPGSIYI